MPDRRVPYLPEQPLLIFAVRPDLVAAVTVGNRESHRVSWTPATGWRCSCRATTSACGHIGAVRALVVLAPAADSLATNGDLS